MSVPIATSKLAADQSRIVTPPSVVIAGAFSASAFAIAILSAAWADRAMADAFGDAVLTLLVCYPIGYVIGGVATVAVDERVDRFKESLPLGSAGSVQLGSDAANESGGVEDLSGGGS